MAVAEHNVHYLEIVTPDAEGARNHYEQAYGWDFAGPTPALGNAFVAALPDGGLCGIRAPMHEQEVPTVRTYLRVADVEAAAQKAAELGAEIALPPTELPGHGTIAIYLLGGIQQGLWQLS